MNISLIYSGVHYGNRAKRSSQPPAGMQENRPQCGRKGISDGLTSTPSLLWRIVCWYEVLGFPPLYLWWIINAYCARFWLLTIVEFVWDLLTMAILRWFDGGAYDMMRFFWFLTVLVTWKVTQDQSLEENMRSALGVGEATSIMWRGLLGVRCKATRWGSTK